MGFSEVKYEAIEDWSQEDKSKVCDVDEEACGTPEGSRELHPTRTRVRQEVCQVVAGKYFFSQ